MAASTKLTDRQSEVLSYVKTYIHDNKTAPSLGDIAKNFSFSSVSALTHVRALEAKGIIKRTKGKNRSMELVKKAKSRAKKAPAAAAASI